MAIVCDLTTTNTLVCVKSMIQNTQTGVNRDKSVVSVGESPDDFARINCDKEYQSEPQFSGGYKERPCAQIQSP